MALLELVNFLNSPQQDEALLRYAGVRLDRALFPLLIRIGISGSIGVVELAEQLGRDHSTISRQLAKLEHLQLIERRPSSHDQRVREAFITRDGKRIVQTITKARRKVFQQLLADWSKEECQSLARLTRKLVDTMNATRLQP